MKYVEKCRFCSKVKLVNDAKLCKRCNKNKRKNVIEKMVKNYYHQVKIVGSTTLTLTNYLKGIKLNKIEIQYALDYDDFRKN